MREIKFRAWDRKAKAMFPVHRMDFSKITNKLEFISGVDIRDKDSNHEGDVAYGGHIDKMTGSPLLRRYELMQYTGLKDSNGKEIYEGDIITWFINNTTYTASIYYDTNQASFWMGKDITKRCGLVLNDWMRGEYEVIGNIYEHGYLLERSKPDQNY